MTYRELVYMVIDELKLLSDDSYYTEDHILFLLKRHRAYLLYLKYIQLKLIKELAETNELEICLDLEVESGGQCLDSYLKSTVKLPQTLDDSTLKINLNNLFAGDINWVSSRRFKYVGHNRFLQNLIYATKGDNDYLYLKSDNPLLLYLDKIRVTGVFEDPEEAEKYSCDDGGEEELSCDILDRQFPIEDSLSVALILSVVKELYSPVLSPRDDENNASDDLSTLATFIRRNMKNEYQRRLNDTTK